MNVGPIVDLRLRSKIPQVELEGKVGKIISPADYNLLLTGPARVRKPDGKPLCVYLPGAMREVSTQEVYEILHPLYTAMTDNRGLASGSLRLAEAEGKRTRSVKVASAIIGAIDPGGVYKYCRMTAWTGSNLPQWQQLQPYLQHVAKHLAEQVPDRYANQVEQAKATREEWVVPGTPFTTVTVNNTYPTGVHTDKGDLDAGFSTIACIRRGQYTGGHLTFPEYRVAVDMQDGDLILMDAHEFHGNTAITCSCGNSLRRLCPDCGAERISTVSYFRSKMVNCGSADQERERAVQRREKKAP